MEHNDIFRVKDIYGLTCVLDNYNNGTIINYLNRFWVEFTYIEQFRCIAMVENISFFDKWDEIEDGVKKTELVNFSMSGRWFEFWIRPDELKNMHTLNGLKSFFNKCTENPAFFKVLSNRFYESKCSSLLQYCLKESAYSLPDIFYFEEDDEEYIDAVENETMDQFWNDVEAYQLYDCFENSDDGYIVVGNGILDRFFLNK